MKSRSSSSIHRCVTQRVVSLRGNITLHYVWMDNVPALSSEFISLTFSGFMMKECGAESQPVRGTAERVDKKAKQTQISLTPLVMRPHFLVWLTGNTGWVNIDQKYTTESFFFGYTFHHRSTLAVMITRWCEQIHQHQLVEGSVTLEPAAGRNTGHRGG